MAEIARCSSTSAQSPTSTASSSSSSSPRNSSGTSAPSPRRVVRCWLCRFLVAPPLFHTHTFHADSSKVTLPFAIIKERHWQTQGGLFVQRATFFEDSVIRCVRYAFANVPARIGRVFLSKGVALPFFWFRLLRRGYLGAPVHWHEYQEVRSSCSWEGRMLMTGRMGSKGYGWRGIQQRSQISCFTMSMASFPPPVMWHVLGLMGRAGGGFSMGSAFFYLEFLMTWLSVLVCSGYSNPVIFALEYTLVPDASYPTQIYEVMEGYRHVLKVAQDPDIVCVSGDSAGGMLVLSLLLHLGKVEGDGEGGIEKPAMAMLISPWVTLLSDKKDSPGRDYLSVGQLNQYGRLLAGDRISPTDPLVSPGCCQDGEWWRRASPSKGFFITYGEDEILAPDIDELITRLDQAGIAVESDKEAGGIHAWPVASVFLSTSDDERLGGLRTMSSEIRRRLA